MKALEMTLLKILSALIIRLCSIKLVQLYGQCKQHLGRVAVACLSYSQDPIDNFRRAWNELSRCAGEACRDLMVRKS
nr:hypothetical protein Iba_chr14cCG1140 [Ipomoea batatas]